jgi:hypothetical protein
MEVNGSASYRPPARSAPMGLSIASIGSPSLRPPPSNRLRGNLLPPLTIQTPRTSPDELRAEVYSNPSRSDDSSPSPVVSQNDFGRQVRECIGDDHDNISGALERLDISTSADGDDEASPSASEIAKEIGSLDEEGWRRAAREDRFVEINVLGEGSSGCVSRCRLRNGTQEFAVKVSLSGVALTENRQYRRTRICNDRYCENYCSIGLVIRLIL